MLEIAPKQRARILIGRQSVRMLPYILCELTVSGIIDTSTGRWALLRSVICILFKLAYAGTDAVRIQHVARHKTASNRNWNEDDARIDDMTSRKYLLYLLSVLLIFPYRRNLREY